MKLVGRRRRAGIAEITGTLLMIAVTLVAGVAVFGWAIGQAGVSEGVLGQSAASQANHYHESFVVVSVQFPSSACSTVTGNTWCNEFSVAVYNNGAVGLTIESVILTSVSTTSASGTAVPALSFSLGLTAATTGTYACSNSGASPCTYTCGTNTGPLSGGSVTETLLPAPTGTNKDEPIATETSPPTVFTVTLPSGCTTGSDILNGAVYSVELVGLYGNVVTTQVTANG